MSDDMKVQVDITADLSKLESSLNTAYEKTRAAGAKMQSSLNLQVGSAGVHTGPGSPTVPAAFNSNQITFGNALNVQRGNAFGMTGGGGVRVPPVVGGPGSPTVPSANSALAAVITGGHFGTLAQAGRIAADIGASTATNGPFALAFAGSDPIAGMRYMSRMNDQFKRIPVGGEALGFIQGVTGTDPAALAQTLSAIRQNKGRAAIAEGQGGYMSRRAAMDLQHSTETTNLNSYWTPGNYWNYKGKKSSLEAAQGAERSNLEFERKWELKQLDVDANSETLRMFGSDFAADQMNIGAKFGRDIETADRAGDSERSRRLQKLRDVTLLSSAMKNVGMGTEMSMQGTALGGVRPGQLNENDPVTQKLLRRIAMAAEDKAGGVPLAR